MKAFAPLFSLAKMTFVLAAKFCIGMSVSAFQIGFALTHPRELLAAIEAQPWPVQATLTLLAFTIVYSAIGQLS